MGRRRLGEGLARRLVRAEPREERPRARGVGLDRLADEVACLRPRFDQRGQELEQRSRELAAGGARFDVIQQPTLHRNEALTATVADQREEDPAAAPEAPGATEAPTEGGTRGSTWVR